MLDRWFAEWRDKRVKKLLENRCDELQLELRREEDQVAARDERILALESALADVIDVALGDGREPMEHEKQTRVRAAQQVLRDKL